MKMSALWNCVKETLNKSCVVIASIAKQSIIRYQSCTYGSPRRYAPRDDGLIQCILKPVCCRRTAGFAVAVATLATVSAADALELAENVQLHGFASQAYIKTSGNKFFGPSDSGSFDFRELGVNLSWQALPMVQFAAQVGSRKAGGTEVNARPRFDYALVDVAPLSGEMGRAGLRAGRYRLPVGLYNLTRDVANVRPSIFLPESIYSDPSRQMVLAMDGGEVYGELRTSYGDFFVNYGKGDFIQDDFTRRSLRKVKSDVWRILYERAGGLLRLALTGATARADVQPSLGGSKIKLDSYILSAQYNAENWSLTGEYTPDSTTVISAPFNVSQRAESYYLQGTYNITPTWEALLRYDVQYKDKNDRTGVKHAAAAPGTPAYSYFTKDWTAGIGWKVRPDTKIRAEWHHVNGTSWLSSKENSPRNNFLAGPMRQYWDMFALQVSYSF